MGAGRWIIDLIVLVSGLVSVFSLSTHEGLQRSLSRGTFVKFISGASNQDAPLVRCQMPLLHNPYIILRS